MCGRFTLAAPADRVAALFGAATRSAIVPRYNIAPSQPVLTVGRKADGRTRGLALMRWGLVPRDTADPKGGRRPINARAETAARLPTFRGSFARRRCLVPADGFYEGQRAGLARVPHHFRRADGGVMALAGLWDAWASPGGEVVRTCCLLTTAANALLRHAHDRMPAILPPEAWDAWLSPTTSAAELRELLRPFPAEQMAAVIVGPAVNSTANDGPECVRPAGRPEHTADPFRGYP